MPQLLVGDGRALPIRIQRRKQPLEGIGAEGPAPSPGGTCCRRATCRGGKTPHGMFLLNALFIVRDIGRSQLTGQGAGSPLEVVTKFSKHAAALAERAKSAAKQTSRRSPTRRR